MVYDTPFSGRPTVTLTPEDYYGVLVNCLINYSSSSQGPASFDYICYATSNSSNGKIFSHAPNAIWWTAIGSP